MWQRCIENSMANMWKRPTKSEHVIREVRSTAPHAYNNIARLCFLNTYIWNPSSVSSSFLTLSCRDDQTFTFFRGVQSYRTLVCYHVQEWKQETENLRSTADFQPRNNGSFNSRIMTIISLVQSERFGSMVWTTRMTQWKWLPPNGRVRALHSSSSLICRLQ